MTSECSKASALRGYRQLRGTGCIEARLPRLDCGGSCPRGRALRRRGAPRLADGLLQHIGARRAGDLLEGRVEVVAAEMEGAQLALREQRGEGVAVLLRAAGVRLGEHDRAEKKPSSCSRPRSRHPSLMSSRRSSAVARTMRRVIGYECGVSPYASRKRRLKCALDISAVRARTATSRGWAYSRSIRSWARAGAASL
jgi:hypothetical protein